MRKISVVLFAALLFTVGNVLAVDPVDNPNKKLSTQIQQMLKSNEFDIEDDITANVRFTLNKEGEIVVLSIDTEHKELEGFVKGRLNYKKVELNAVNEGKIYTVPVRITA